MKQLLHITAHLGGGAGKAISGLIQNIEGYENVVVLLEAPQDDKYCKVCEDAGCKVIVAPCRDEIISLAEKADAVVFNWWSHPLSVDLLRELVDVPTRLLIWSHINGLQYPVLTADFLDAFDGIMLTSPCSVKNERFTEEQKQRLLQKCSFVYGMGNFHPEAFPYKSNYEFGNRVRIGYIGTLDFAKLNPAFPRICSEIKRSVSNAEFILCGKFTEEFKRSFFSDDPSLEECTVFTGFVTDPVKHLQSFDVFCYPLAEENYATTENALLEAMAVGLPVVVLNNPAEREIVDNDVTGLVADDVDDFIRRTVDLCGDACQRSMFGKAAREYVIKKYSAKNNAGSFVGCVEKSLFSEKHKHDFKELIGNDIWENFLNFCGDDRDKIVRLMNGENMKLSGVYYSESKSSPRHYSQYFENSNLTNLVERLTK